MRHRVFQLLKSDRFYRRKVLSEYVGLMKLVLLLTTAWAISGCGSKSMPWHCLGDENTVGYRPLMCREKNCPFCSEVATRHLVDYKMYVVREIYHKLGRYGRDVSFVRGEFTVPFDLQSKVPIGVLSELNSRAKKVLVEYLNKPAGLKLGIISVPQYWHSADPLGLGKFGGYFPHVHYVVFDIGFNEKENRAVPLSLYVNNDDGFVRLRAMWRAELESWLGKSDALDVDCKYRVSHGLDDLEHRLDYMFRSPVRDLYKFVNQNGVPKDADLSWLRSCLVGRGHQQRVSYWGWMSPVSMSGGSSWMKFLGLKLLSRKEFSGERKKVVCPNCGCFMERVVYGLIEDTEELLSRGSLMVVVDPRYDAFYGG